MTRAVDGDFALHEVNFSDRGPADADLDRFRDDGVIVLRNFFDPAAYCGIIHDLDRRLRLLEQKDRLACPAPQPCNVESVSRRLTALDARRPGTQSILYDAMSKSPAMHAIASTGDVIALAERFVPAPVAHHDRFILLMSMPEESWHLAGWHQDWYYNEGPPGTITLYAPLQPTDAENGLLRFALGEHKRGLLSHGEFTVDSGADFATKWHTIDPAEIDGFRHIASTSLEVGDLVIFNSLVPHSAQINRSQSIRFVLNLRYHGLNDDDFIEDGWRIGKIDHARGALSRAPQSSPRKEKALI